ncbi:MAG: NAD-dependent epimerase/dehydratase family protein [Proteobacteria bacterium]|nr:NAD-dependent epimerase/dehydratase family protein [Pseudomonadota bacterium]
MKILITGGAGFIGSHLCDTLLAAGHEVVAIDNLSLGRKANLAHLEGDARFRLVIGEILDDTVFAPLVAGGGFDCVFHMAANSDIARSHAAPSIDFDRTFLTTFRVLEAMRGANIKKLVFASTSAIYGEAGGLVAEDHGPLSPISHYGAGKLASEAFISSFGENYGIQSWITRFPNVVGGRATHGAVFDFVHRLIADRTALKVLGNGKQVKPYLFVSDLVDAIMTVFTRCDEPTNIYNVGVETTTTVADIARFVLEEGGIDAPIVYTGGDRGWIGDVPQFAYDISKLTRLGWRASMTSDEAVRRAARAIWAESL